MKKEELTQKSIQLITEYYDNNLQPFFDTVSDNVLWIGPRAGQVLQGKDAIINAWTGDETNLRFTMSSIEAKNIAIGTGGLEVILEYYVYTYFPGGEIDRHHQRLHFSWGYQGKGADRMPKVFMIHISNIAGALENDGTRVKVYAGSHLESSIDSVGIPDMSRIHFRTVYGKGADEVTFLFNSSNILWIESTDRSLHSAVHTMEETYTAIEKLRYFEEQFGDSLLRIHTSYLVNPMYIRSVKRFEVTMTDGTVIPIPEKKYTSVKKKILDWDESRVGN